MQLPIRTRLVLALAAIILLGAAGAAYLLFALHEVGRAMDEVRRRGDAVRDSLTLAASFRDQYAHEAHVLLLPEPADHVHHFDDAARSVESSLGRIRDAAADETERLLVERIGVEVGRFERLFRDDLLPAFRRGDRARALRVHEESEALLEVVVRLTDDLSGRCLAAIDGAQHRAQVLESRAAEVGAGLLILSLLVAFAIAAHLVRSIHAPIAALVRGTQEVAQGDLESKIRLETRDEFGALAASFNEMTSRLRANQEELVRAGRLAALGRLAAGVAHQVNNPLGVIMGYAGVLGDSRYDEAARAKALAAIRDEAQECRTVVQNLMSLARPGVIDVERVSLRELLETALEKARRYARFDGVTVSPLRIDVDSVETDRRKLEQAVLNLIVNAAEAMPRGGSLTVAAVAAGQGARIEVTDTGPGMTADERTRLFDLYFTTKPQGTGLGLAFAHALVHAVGGSIDVESEPGLGSCFRITIPARAVPLPLPAGPS